MRTVVFVAIVAFIGGMHVGGWLERDHNAWRSSERPAARGVEETVVGRTTLPPLRCAQATTFDARNTPQYTRQPWTQERAEAEIEYAWQSLSTARHYGGNAALKQAWATEALAALELIKACWRGP